MNCAGYAKLGNYFNIMMPVTKDDFNKSKYTLTMEGYTSDSKVSNKTYQNEFASNYVNGIPGAKTSKAQISDPCYFSQGPYSSFVQSGDNNNQTCDQKTADGKYICGHCESPMTTEKQTISVEAPCGGFKVTGSSNGSLFGSCAVSESFESRPCFPDLPDGKPNPKNDCSDRRNSAFCESTSLRQKNSRIKNCRCNAQNKCIRPDGI